MPAELLFWHQNDVTLAKAVLLRTALQDAAAPDDMLGR